MNGSFVIPFKSRLKWFYYFLQLSALAAIVTLTVLVASGFSMAEIAISRQILFYVSSALVITCCISFFFDVHNILPAYGLELKDEALYVLGWIKKFKVPYDRVEELVLYPTLLSLSGPTGSRAWVRLKTKKTSLLFVAPQHQLLRTEAEKRGVRVRESKKLLVVFVVAALVCVFTKLISLIFAILLLRGFFSKNGYFSRRSELLSLVSLALIIVSIIFVVAPTLYFSQRFAGVQKALKNHDYQELTRFCEHPSPIGNPAIMNECAWFYTIAADPRFRDYNRAIELASQAVEGANSDSLRNDAAGTLACAYMGGGQKAYALKVVADYHLNPTGKPNFLTGKFCEE